MLVGVCFLVLPAEERRKPASQAAGYAINPARDFGPRLFAWLAGWGDVALPGVHDYFWVPIVGPLIGGVVGAIIYDFFIGGMLKARGEHPEPDVEPKGRTVEEVPET